MNEIRRRAQAQRIALGLALEEAHPVDAVVSACLAALGGPSKAQDEGQPQTVPRFDTLHHCAHVWLHGEGHPCAGGAVAQGERSEAATGAWGKVDGGTLKARREEEADLFASEMLLPGPLAHRLFWNERRSSEEIAAQLGLPGGWVQRQLGDTVLLPMDAAPRPFLLPGDEGKTAPASAPPLDEFQRAAAEVALGPLLLGAGPGTGKTKTLVGRCRFLTQAQGVPAEKILALTFSRQAAQEMRERLAQAGVGTLETGPWVGTFHGFGLDILRRFGDRLGLSAEIKLLDTLDAVTLLENHLPRLGLDVLDNLYNPAIHLGGILRQIARAKDELCPPERYALLCREMGAQAERAMHEFGSQPGKKLKRDEDAVAKAVEQAGKAQEVARCFAVYESLLQEQGLLDFADLIARAVALLEAHPDVLQTLRAEYLHVLADEYQDVNRACAHLVRLLAGEEARGLWAVGDHRQSIYRFRGASPANVAAFHQDYPNGQRMELGVNYRSRQPIVDLFGVAARGMEPASPERRGAEEAGLSSLWRAQRGRKAEAAFPAVTLAVAPDEEGQADGIARAIRDLQAAGKPYRDQAILCRTHGQAESLAALLSARDIPVLYLGALLERPEVKDLLCLLSLLADQDGSGLLRVAGWPEYRVPQEEALALLARAAFTQTPLLEALQEAELSDGLRRLGAHLEGLRALENDPAGLLRHYLFGQSRYLRHLVANEPRLFLSTQRLLAIHQLLGLAENFDRRLVAPGGQAKSGNKVREFLTHLRRLSASGESLRGIVPPEAEGLDAVRILTAHAAKGLEYPVVFLPNLGAGQFPARGRHDGLPEPTGLTAMAGQETDEEECLFFVALSRARDHLIVSRSETGGADRAVKPSPLLGLIRPWFAAQGVSETAWPTGRVAKEAAEALLPVPGDLPTYSLSALETYLRCPRQFYYGQELKLTGTFALGGYPQFHACLRQALRWLEDERTAGREPTGEAAAAHWEAVWAANGPAGHLHEQKYKDSALHMLQTAVRRNHEAEEPLDTKTLHVTLSQCRVRVRPDVVRLNTADGTLIVARELTGKPGEDDKNDKRLALFRRAASETHPTHPLRLELRYLSDGTRVEVEPPTTDYKAKLEAERVAKYENAAWGIALRAFEARRSDECQACAYGLICPL